MKKVHTKKKEQKSEQEIFTEKEKLQRIEELHKTDREASINGDFSTLMTLLTDDCVLLPPNDSPITGKVAIEEYFDGQKELLHAIEITEYTHDFQEIKVIGNWAYEWGYFSNTAKSKDSGELIKGSGKLFRILELQDDGSWKVTRSIWNVNPESE